MDSAGLPHFLFVGDLKILSVMLCNMLVSDHDLKNEVYYMSRVLVSGHGLKNETFL